MRVVHPRLDKNELGQLIFNFPTQEKSRDTSCIYVIETNILTIAGKVIDKHPKFRNIVQFEDWCNRYFGQNSSKCVHYIQVQL